MPSGAWSSGIRCPCCGSYNVQVVANTSGKIKRRGCLMSLLWICLIVCTGGLALIFALLTSGSHGKIKTKTQFVCMNCGKKF